MEKVRVGISVGDINGVGLEVIIKTLSDSRILDYIIPIIYGSSKVVSYHKNIVKPAEFIFNSASTIDQINPDKINVVNCWTEDITIDLGHPNEDSGKFAYTALDQATNDIKSGHIDVLVTAPIDKHAMSLAGFPHPGHTEYLTANSGTEQSLMLLINDTLRVGLVSNHVPIEEVPAQVTKETIIKKLQIFNHALKQDFGIEKPVIAVLGLNPHAGDGGLLGEEEEVQIKPAILEMRKKGMMVGGPFSADGFFGSGQFRKVDGILAMYHDQGLIPFKTLSFGNGVNFTAGLPFIRTSPDHGTAASIAGQNKADETSFRSAIFAAIDIFRNRQVYHSGHANPLTKNTLVEEAPDEANPQQIEDES